MFTGIITDIGEIVKADHNNNELIMEIKTKYDLNTIDLGASIATDGVCLTVMEKFDDSYVVYASAETLAVTNLVGYKVGTKVNLERAMKLGDELGGHMVAGHVDFLSKVISIEKVGESHIFEFEIKQDYAKYFSLKGSVVINGVSLTIIELTEKSFKVNIISHTLANTTFQYYNIDDIINIEVDMIAKYLSGLISRG